MNPGPAKLPTAVVVGLLIAIVLDTVIQITWKLSVAQVPDGATTAVVIGTALRSPYFYVAMAAFGAQLFNWVRVLARTDLSFAQPFTALSYISVLIISWHSLQEVISGQKMAGVALILTGVFLISRTSHTTGSGAARPPPVFPQS